MIDGGMQPYALTLDKFLDHAAKWHPHAEVITAVGGGAVQRAGYASLRERAGRVSALLAGLGVGLGDRVATLAWNSQAHVEAWYGIMGLGAACHTLNPRVTAEQSAVMLAQSGAAIVIVSVDLLPLACTILDRAPSVTRVLVIDGAPGAGDALPACPLSLLDPDQLAPGDEPVWGGFDETTASGLCFTSGTTGAPKGVVYSHRSGYLHTLRLLQADVVGLTAADTVLAAVPMFHANAWGLPFAAPAVGARLVLPGRHLDGASLAGLIAEQGVTVAAGVPTVWLGLLNHIEAHGGELPSLKRLMVGGAPMSEALMARLEQRLGVTVQTSWGMTELSPLGTITPPDDPGRQAAWAGRPAMGVDLRLTDEHGEPLAEQRDREGHLWVRGASVVGRYLGHDQPATDDQGWFATGDLARIDGHGNLIITGRAKDLIKSGGEWINPGEIEAIVGALASVSQAAVIGRADARWGERPLLIVETNGAAPADDQEILDALRGRVASWWLPDAVIRVPAMPLAATGKIDKMRLRSEYGQ